jgi:hypothetical protein
VFSGTLTTDTDVVFQLRFHYGPAMRPSLAWSSVAQVGPLCPPPSPSPTATPAPVIVGPDTGTAVTCTPSDVFLLSDASGPLVIQSTDKLLAG